ncbi:unnamed protein product (macronuclear) [Paramecium tetraurelia]|uniref:Transmembrane protein n=1 Tax=Paramecium tetraurelia TaxID=5888 RepID=A0C4G6_PARTE|nr:uncharacterized protein GSPATT00035163001 [Paramecium tetraurelia]CAK65683.1 unnamed protein product [Paramecium tetraurelia]|eukprot:XP_001433080.1 hypothetical protein (macronuclear) [Paramecium tetraurelia strain d4-2]
MMKTLTIGNINELIQLSEEEFTKAEENARMANRGVVSFYSMFAIAIHIVLCVEVFGYENTASKVCSILASAFFMVQHCYNGRIGCLFNLCCALPICIAGFAISKVKLVNTLAFIFQLCIWLGEYYYLVIQINTDALLKQRPKAQQGTNDQNSGKLVIKVDGLQLSNTQQQEIKKEINELAGLLQNGLQQINHQQQHQQELAEKQQKQEENPTQQN